MSKSGSSIQYGRSNPSGTSTSRRRNGVSSSMRSRISCLVASSPAPPGAPLGSYRLSDETWPNTLDVSMLRKLASIPDSCFMAGCYVDARRWVARERRTASTQPTATQIEKMNHWMAYDRCGPRSRSGASTGAG